MRRRHGLVAVALMLGVALAGGLLAASRPRGYSVVRTIPVGAATDAMALSALAGRLYLADQVNLTVSVLDTTSGRVLTSTLVMGAPSSLVVDDRDKHVFVATSSTNGIDMLDARSGAFLATVRINQAAGQWANGPSAVDSRDRHVFVTSVNTSTADGYVNILSARRDTLLHTTRVGQNPAALAADAQSARVFVATLGPLSQGNATGPGSVSILDARNGRLLRTIHAGVWPDVLAIDSATNRVFVVNNPAQGTGSVTVLDATSGRRLRSVAVGRFPGSAVVDVPHGRVSIGSSAGVAMLDARDGRLLRVTPLAPDPITTITGVVAVDERRGRVIALTGSSLSLLDTRDGRLVRTLSGVAGTATQFDDSGTVALDARSGRVFVLAAGPRYAQGNPKGTGTVSVVDDQSGRLVQTITVGLLPTQIAVDERTGHVFVLNAGCPAPMLPCGGAAPTDLLGWLPSWLRRRLPWFPVPHRPSTSGTVSMLDVSR